MCYGWVPLSEEQLIKLHKMREKHNIRKDMADEIMTINTKTFGEVKILINYIGEGMQCRIQFG